MSENTFSLRSEARPVPYWKHHRRAQESINFIIRVINAAADRVKESEETSADSSLDTNRASRICFVSGEPGSGKSTLYLTLRAMLAKKENIYSEGYSHATGKNLSNLQGAVKLLDPLDLEVAGNEGENLLAAVLVRLFRNLTPPSSSNINSGNCEDAIKELEELATDIGIAWDGNLQARAGALDPDTYSGEVMRTQSARLGVNERLRGALTKITEKECFGCTKETLFVLPVDDLYLNPNASLQLLRLLRMISIPRLFFLVMGDINTVEALFIEKSLADWTGVAGNELFAYNPIRFEDALTRARELRARYLRKLLPPGQRTTIAAMDWYEALNLEVGLAENKEKTGEVLEEILAKVKLDKQLSGDPPKFDSLLSFLISPPLTYFCPKDFETEKQTRADIIKGSKDTEKVSSDDFSLNKKQLRKYRSAYTAVQILDSTPREMLDLASSFREIILKQENSLKEPVEERTPELLSSIRDTVNLVREENSFLNSEQQRILEEVLPTQVYYPEDLNFKTDRLSLEQIKRPWKEQIPGELWVRSHRSWDLGPHLEEKANNDVPDEKEVGSIPAKKKNGNTPAKKKDYLTFFDKNPFAKLPPRPAAWFILLHDIAWEWNPDSITENLVNKLCQELNNRIEQKPEDGKKFGGASGWAFGFDGKEYKHFPMPEFNTFRDLDRFLFVWNRGLEWLEEQKKRADELENETFEAKAQLASAQKEVEKFEARESDTAQKKENDILQKKAATEATHQNPQQKQQRDEILEQIGTNSSERFEKLIYLWGLAVSTVLDEQYDDDFAIKDSKSGSDWFHQNLLNFTIDRYKNRLSSKCQKTLENFLRR